MSDDESVASLELGQEVEDDEQQGSPKSVAWKYAWSMESSQAVSVNGAGNAASERLYKGARSQRETRERLQRMELKRQDYKAGPHKPAINKNSAAMAETRFDDVMNKTAIGRYRKDIRAIAGAKDGSGSREKQRVQEVFNYGDMLFQEGKMSAARKEKKKAEELARRREQEAKEATFKPKVSGYAKHFAHAEHMAERADLLLVEHQERMQVLATVVRAEADRDLTFKPANSNQKLTDKLAGPRERDFVQEMEKRNMSSQLKLQALRAQYEEQDRSSFTYKPEVGRTPRTAGQHGASARGRAGGPKKEGAGKKEPPIHERLYVAHTAAYGQSLKPAETSDPECTFRPNLGSPEAANPGRSQAGESAAAAAPPPRTRAQLEEVGEALYRDAHNRRIRRQMVEAQLSSELEQARSSSKISSRSEEMAFSKLQRDVADIYEQLGATERGVTYEELAAALVELGLFKTASAAPTAADDNQVVLLQRVWRHLVEAADLEATLPCAALLRFLRAALLPQDEAAAAAYPPPATDATLLADFARLWRNTLSYKTTRNIRGHTEHALQREAEQCTFNPAIDKRSRAMQQGNGEAALTGAARAHKLYDQAKGRDERIQRQRVEAAQEKMRECSFKPEINASARAPLPASKGGPAAEAAAAEGGAPSHGGPSSHGPSHGASHGARRSSQGSSVEAGERLYSHAQQKAMAEEATLSTLDIEVAEQCSFKPQLAASLRSYNASNNPHSPRKGGAHSLKPPGYQQAVGRMRRAQEEKEAREAEEQSIASARAASTSAAGSTSVRPFSFQTDKRQERKQPLLYMDVNLGPGRTGRIGLHQDDDAGLLAANFARAYQLDGAMRDRLQQLIEKYMAEVLPDLASQAGTDLPRSDRSSPARQATPASPAHTDGSS